MGSTYESLNTLGNQPDRPAGTYPVSEGKVAMTQYLNNAILTRSPEEILEQYSVEDMKPATTDRIFRIELPQAVNGLESWVSPIVLEGLQKRATRMLNTWNEFRLSTNLSDENWKDNPEKWHRFLRLSAWALQFQTELTEIRTELGFAAELRMW